MFIKSATVSNYKCLQPCTIDFALPDGVTPGSGLNIFVGENNSGKSSLMESIYFLRNKAKGNIKKNGTTETDSFYVEITFTGDLENSIDNFVQDNKKTAFKKCIYEENSKKFLKVRREFKTEEDIKKILFCENGEYKNISGIDASFQALFQISNIWADTNPENESKFGASTICGNLLLEISEKIKDSSSKEYEDYLKAFNALFNNDTSGLQNELNILADETEKVLNEQFGDAKLKFKFNSPELKEVFKNLRILVDDGEETDISEKGHGMQRAVILSLLQVYAKRITTNPENDVIKPHFLFIDEPEMGLHPQAQLKLFEALKIISKTAQVFISTHSENFIDTELIKNIIRFIPNNRSIKMISGRNLTIDLKANRKFFLHHHKLFFAKDVIFVEGADDFDRYSRFLKVKGQDQTSKKLYFLAGVSDMSVFYELCKYFEIKASFIFDVDIIAKSNCGLKNFNNDIWNKIIKLNKETSKKNPEKLLDSNLSDEEKKLKYEIINDLKKYGMYVLNNGAVEQYLDENGTKIDDTKEKELENIFQSINV